MLTVLDLFSGIGGFSLGLERTGGFRTVAFCEIDPYCRAVLAKHWPDVPVLGDVRDVTADSIAQALANANGNAGPWSGEQACESAITWPQHSAAVLERSGVDVICGGFPCQDISVAGKGAGLAASRSGLWKEYARIIGELRPRYVIVENVAALLSRGLGDVLGGLATLGYDAEWHCIPASAVGAPHRRDRIWIVAYPQRDILRQQSGRRDGTRGAGASELGDDGAAEPLADAIGLRKLQSEGRLSDIGGWIGDCGWWLAEPDVGRMAHGVPARVDRLKALGNAVVPQIPEIIGRAIMRAVSHVA